MRNSDLRCLESLIGAQYRARQVAWSKAIIEIEEIKDKIRQTDENRRRSYVNDLSLTKLKSIGGDVLWQSWLVRKRRLLEVTLSHKMANLSEARRLMQLDYGKTLSIETQLNLNEDEEKKRADRVRMMKISEAYMMSDLKLRDL